MAIPVETFPPHARPRKRSRSARLLLMGAAPLALTACEGQQDAVLYADAKECAAAGRLSAEQCEGAFAVARGEHERIAPHYLSREDCIRDYGIDQCTTARDGSGAFIPFMGGMLLGQALGGGRGYYPQPVYRPRDGEWRTPGGIGFGRSTGDIRIGRSATVPQTRAITASRSGFGSRAAARGGWGG